MPKSCLQCDTQLVDTAKFCKTCGTQQQPQQAQPSHGQYQQPQQRTEDNVWEQANNSTRGNVASGELRRNVTASLLERIPNWIRWALAYPFAILATVPIGVLSFLLIDFISNGGRDVAVAGLIMWATGGVIGYVFVRISTEIVPTYKKIVSIVSVCLIILEVGRSAGVTLGFISPFYHSAVIVNYLATIVGAVIAAMLIRKKDSKATSSPRKARVGNAHRNKPSQGAGAVRSAWEESIVNTICQRYPLLAIEANNRTVIPSRKYPSKYLEIDIWIPELRLGIEANGLKWHDKAAYDKDKQYGTSHSNEMYKENFCNSKNIMLLHVWGNESPSEIHSKINSAIEAQKNNPNVVPYVDAKEVTKDKLRVAAIASVVIYFLLVVTAVFPISNFSDIVIGYAIVFAL
ncbi:MAG: hypothetical protein FWD93_05650, partial [Coriobacteriia bacterium]|nr:hypothetical protein [Coriobacteriia bacterium]